MSVQIQIPKGSKLLIGAKKSSEVLNENCGSKAFKSSGLLGLKISLYNNEGQSLEKARCGSIKNKFHKFFNVKMRFLGSQEPLKGVSSGLTEKKIIEKYRELVKNPLQWKIWDATQVQSFFLNWRRSQRRWGS